MACTCKPYQSKSEQGLNPYWRKKSALLARVERKRLVLLDVLKNWIDMSKFLNFVTRGLRRLTLALGLAYQDERCGDGWPMAPFPKPDGGADDPASSIRYARYVLQWWQAGNRNGLQLYRALTAQGYRGSSKAMYRYLERLRTPQRPSLGVTPSKAQRPESVLASSALLENFSAQRATWLFVCQPEKLDERQQAELALIRQASPNAETAYGLAQAFMQMIREQTGQQLDTWLSLVEASHLPELESFAKGIQQDKRAVFAGLTLPYSNGPLEGHVNRLKLIKRSMYGRAKLPLLRARVLHVAEKEPSRAAIPAS